jgi:hypothetical protein
MHDDQMAQRIAALEQELARLKQDVHDADERPASRREMFKKLAVVGAGAAAGAALLPGQAKAATGDTLFAGWSVGATNITRIRNGTFSPVVGTPLTSEATMFWVDNRLSTIDNAHGLRGDGKGPLGLGLWGNSDSNGTGVYGGGGLGLRGYGTRAGLMLDGVGTAPPSRTDAHERGEVVHDENGTLWFCVASGTPGTWRQVAGPSTAGQLHLLPAPARAYDSRETGGPLPTGSERIVSVRSGKVGTPPVTVTAVPEGAGGALISLTLTGTNGAGFLAVFTDGITWPGNSNTNWYAAGQSLAVTTVTGVSSTGRVVVHAGGNGTTDFIIDVIGYYA